MVMLLPMNPESLSNPPQDEITMLLLSQVAAPPFLPVIHVSVYEVGPSIKETVAYPVGRKVSGSFT